MTTGKSAIPVRGDVVLVPFPFAELTASKARPAVVISGASFFQAEGKLIVAAITSNLAHVRATNLQLSAWRACGLLKPSVVTSWLATLAPELVLMRIGALKQEQVRAMEACLRAALELVE